MKIELGTAPLKKSYVIVGPKISESPYQSKEEKKWFDVDQG